MADAFRYPFRRSNNYLGAYRLLPSTNAALPILEDMQFESAGGGAANLSASQTVAAVTQSGALDGDAALVASQQIGSVTQSGSMALVAAATATQAIGSVSQTATLAVVGVSSLTAAQTIGAVTQAATVARVAVLAAGQQLGSVTQAGAMDGDAAVSASQSIGAVTQSGVLSGILSVSAGQQIGGVTQSATLGVQAVSNLVAAQQIGDVRQFGAIESGAVMATDGSYASVFGLRKKRRKDEDDDAEPETVSIITIGKANQPIVITERIKPDTRVRLPKATGGTRHLVEKEQIVALSKRRQRIRKLQSSDDEWLMMM